MNEFEKKAAAVLADPNYVNSLEREQAEAARREKAVKAARLRELARVAVQALKGEHGAQAQTDATIALTKGGDIRPDVEALARWDMDVRMQRKPVPLDVPVIKRALESHIVEYSLRTLEALLRETRNNERKKTP